MYLIVQMKEELKEILNTNKKVILIASDFSRIEEALAILDMHKYIKCYLCMAGVFDYGEEGIISFDKAIRSLIS